MVLVLKTSEGKTSVGSNPTLSAIINKVIMFGEVLKRLKRTVC